jgi:predicted N-acetyltransferase YhbS
METALVEIGPRDHGLHDSYVAFITQVSGEQQFRPWADRGGWGDDYTAFALMENDEIIATVGRMSMRFVVDGAISAGYQLGAIATRPDRRNQGHMRRLIEHILALPPLDNRTTLIFAVSDTAAIYPRFGFERITEWQFQLPVSAFPSLVSAVDLDIGSADDRALLRSACREAIELSEDFSAVDYYPILLWHLSHRALTAKRLIDAEAIVIVQQTGANLHICDIVTPRKITIMDHIPMLASGPIKMVSFGFNPQGWLTIEDSEKLERSETDEAAGILFSLGRPSPKGRIGRLPELARI